MGIICCKCEKEQHDVAIQTLSIHDEDYETMTNITLFLSEESNHTIFND